MMNLILARYYLFWKRKRLYKLCTAHKSYTSHSSSFWEYISYKYFISLCPFWLLKRFSIGLLSWCANTFRVWITSTKLATTCWFMNIISFTTWVVYLAFLWNRNNKSSGTHELAFNLQERNIWILRVLSLNLVWHFY